MYEVGIGDLAEICCDTESATLCLLTVELAEVNGSELISSLEATWELTRDFFKILDEAINM